MFANLIFHFFFSLVKIVFVIFLHCVQPESVIFKSIRIIFELVQNSLGYFYANPDVFQFFDVFLTRIDNRYIPKPAFAITITSSSSLNDGIEACQVTDDRAEINIHACFDRAC